jgi:hypothetical protein
MNHNDLIRLLTRILPWIPSINDSIRDEIQQTIDQLKAQQRQ